MVSPALEEKPRWAHECDKCTYLGSYFVSDLYLCWKDPLFPVLLQRYGSQGQKVSAPVYLAHMTNALDEAKQRAIVRGLLPPEDRWNALGWVL